MSKKENLIQWIVLGVLAVIGLVAMILILFGHKGDMNFLKDDSSSEVSESRESTPVVQPLESEASSGKTESSQEESKTESVPLRPESPIGKWVLGGVDDEYFDDALFIGDSRTVGLFCCGMIDNAMYFAQVGIGNNGLLYSTLKVPGYGTYDLDELLSYYDFSKVYIMSGINSLSASPEGVFEDFCTLLNEVRIYCPDAVIYVQSNIKATYERASGVWFLSPSRIDEYNDLLKTLDNGEDVIFLDIAALFETEDGYLDSSKSVDGLHLTDRGSLEWAYYLKTHALIQEGDEVEHDPSEMDWDYPGYDGSQFTPMPRNENPEESALNPEDSQVGGESSTETSTPTDESSQEGSVPTGEDSTPTEEESTPPEGSTPTEESTPPEETPGESTPPEESTPAEDSTPPEETPGESTPPEETPGETENTGETPGETEDPGETENPGDAGDTDETPGEE